MAGNLHKRLADLTYEPDFMVEDVLSEHAAMFYKLDTQLNPPPYQELFDEWPKNDEARERYVCTHRGEWGMGVRERVRVRLFLRPCSDSVCAFSPTSQGHEEKFGGLDGV